MIKNLNQNIKQFVRFGMVGISNNVVFLIFYYLLLYFHVPYMIANICGYIISSFSGYILNKKWVFKAKQIQTKKSLTKYYFTYATALVINICSMYLFVDMIRISENIAPYLVLCITIPYNFIMSKLWIYK